MKKKYRDLVFAKLEKRHKRQGFPEGVYCPGKTREQILGIVRAQLRTREPLILTRAEPALYSYLRKRVKGLKFSVQAGIIYANGIKGSRGLVAVVTAGTSDIPVAEEAAVVLELTGNRVVRHYDAGVAGVHRLLCGLETLSKANVAVVVAGMDGALPSIAGGLLQVPVIAVPTSVGYGANFAGLAPLLTMLNSCASNVSVVNINNGFSAGVIAHIINQQAVR